MASAPAIKTEKYGEFLVAVTNGNPGLNLPQRMGKALWFPMFLMAIMAFPVALILGIVRASAVSDGDASTAFALAHVTTGVMFIGFMGVFSAIVFAIARILGAFREGGGTVQTAAGRRVLTLVMPNTAKAMIVLMMMGMMMLLAGIIAEFALAAVGSGAITDGDNALLQTTQSWSTWITGLRRFGNTTYLLSIALGLYTIVNVIRLQSKRIRELGDEPALNAG
ncbi:MAG: hypothetical protein O2826_09390 [Chloroflexi bacterium]|nr:hypothetical protein [Chloroflexota bacterium]MDA1174715.1 hypothetical protein [Chloroflexota bacterium]